MRLVVAATAIVATLVVGVDTAAACSCAAEPPREKLAAADGAFNGRLLDATPSGQFEAVYRYRIGQVFKGRKRLHRGKIVKVRSGSNDGAVRPASGDRQALRPVRVPPGRALGRQQLQRGLPRSAPPGRPQGELVHGRRPLGQLRLAGPQWPNLTRTTSPAPASVLWVEM